MDVFFKKNDDFNLESIKEHIEKMNKIQHIEILKILKCNKTIKLNENRNGIYINLSFTPAESIDELINYIMYIDEQEKSLEIIEIQKRELSNQIPEK
jgi:hypothetical protein